MISVLVCSCVGVLSALRVNGEAEVYANILVHVANKKTDQQTNTLTLKALNTLSQNKSDSY